MRSILPINLVCFVWLACGAIRLVQAQTENIPEAELSALQDFFVSTNGTYWNWTPGNSSGSVWNFTADANPCADNWQGVTCTIETAGEDRHISELSLPDYNLQGTIPESIGNWTHLQSLFLPNNFLYGSIPVTPWSRLQNITTINLNLNFHTGSVPSTFGQLKHLSELQLSLNELNGSIPESLGDASRLIVLHLDNNYLRGSIPPSLGQLTQLESLALFYTYLSGPIPAELGALSKLRQFFAFHTHLTGTIPSSLGQLTNLTALIFSNGRLDGTIPDTLCQLTNLAALGFGGNRLTGTIPLCVGELTEVSYFSVDVNYLEGTIPSTLANLDQLVIFEVSQNFFTGTIPMFLCTFPEITHIFMYGNKLSGTIPDCLADLSLLQLLGAWGNELVGTLPPALMLLPNMTNLWFGYNYLTGTLPDFSALTQLDELALYYNYFTGTVPDCFTGLTVMTLLELGHNLFTGTLPDSMGYLSTLLQLDAETNLLTGTIPASFTQLAGTQEVFLNTNFLSGSLEKVFNASTQKQLSVLFIQDNQLTGTLPDELFRLPQLSTFVAVSNCFTGMLSPAVCDSPRMVSLILDGLHTSPACRMDLISATHSYEIENNFHGTIPPCMLTMYALVSLHLSGNGLTGTLPGGNSAVARHLVDLTVSHNALTGTVPLNLQTRNWRTLDLSYNRFTGGLEPSFGVALQQSTELFLNKSFNATENSVAMQNNRLSGQFPTPLKQMQNVSMLGSNLFSCKVDKSDLPKHDSDRANYQCGSDAFDAPFYVVIAAAIVILLLAGCYLKRDFLSSQTLAETARWIQKWTETVCDSPSSLKNVMSVSDTLCHIGVVSTIIVVLVLVPWYAVASHYYGTYTYQYAWVVSAAFLSGVTPAATEFALYCVLILTLAAVAMRLQGSLLIASQSTTGDASSARTASAIDAVRVQAEGWRRAAVFALILSVNMVIVGGVNAAFVTVALTQSSGLFVLAQVLMSLFKLFWNAVCSPYLISAAAKLTAQGSEDSSLATLHVFLGLFNNIAIPCVVVGVLSPSCFYSVFDAAPPVTSTYVVQYCYFGSKFGYCTFHGAGFLSSSYNPPFAYSYQCSSSFITYYAPAFVYLGLAAGVVAPLSKVLGIVLLRKASVGGRLHIALTRLLPPLLSLQSPPRDADGQLLTVERDTHLFNAKTFVVTLITYLGILLTFGVVFPPLAVVMCATMLSVAWQAKLTLGRFLQDSVERNLSFAIAAVERDCRAATSVQQLQRSLFLIICFCCCFYALFLFDTLGDAVGPRNAYWVLIVFPLLPLVVIAATAVSNACKKSPDPKAAEEPDRTNSVLEMKSSVSSRGSRVSAAVGRGQVSDVQEADRDQKHPPETYSALQRPSTDV